MVEKKIMRVILTVLLMHDEIISKSPRSKLEIPRKN